MPDRSTIPSSLRLALTRLPVIALLLLGGCAAAGHRAGDDFNDPFENANRAFFRFNQKVDQYALVPVAKGYIAVFPTQAREAFRHFFENMRGPIILTNDVLQAKFRLAGKTAARFVINSTLGMAGFVDLAGRWGIPYHYQDFGLTFAVWGIPEGPYLVVPLLGPSNPRDLTGTVAEGFADPWDIMATNAHYLWAPLIRHAVAGIDERSQYIDTLADIERTSLDYYATIRSLYRQRRNALLHQEEQKKLPPNPSFGSGGPTPANPEPAAPQPLSAPVIAELLPPAASGPLGPATLTPPPDLTTPAPLRPATPTKRQPAAPSGSGTLTPPKDSATLTPPPDLSTPAPPHPAAPAASRPAVAIGPSAGAGAKMKVGALKALLMATLMPPRAAPPHAAAPVTGEPAGPGAPPAEAVTNMGPLKRLLLATLAPPGATSTPPNSSPSSGQ